MENENGQLATFSVSGWLPNGMRVYFTIPMPNGVSAFDQALMFTNGLLEKGFIQHEPGLGDGEHRETIGWVGRRAKVNDDGTETPVLDLYVNNEGMQHRFIGVYLDTPEEVTAFETASGLKLTSIPLNPTGSPVDRSNTALVVRAPKPFVIIYKDNPRYDENSKDKKPKRYFERFDGIPSKSNQKGSNSSAAAESPISDADTWDKPAVEQFVNHYNGKLTIPQLLTALGGIEKFGEWKQGKRAAYIAAEGALSLAAIDF